MTTTLTDDCITTKDDSMNNKISEFSTPMSVDKTNKKSISSSNVSQNMNPTTTVRLQLPTLINANVQDFSDTLMDVDTDPSRKITLPASIKEKQDSTKAKRPASAERNSNTSLRDSLTVAGEKNNKILYSNSDCPPYIIHVYSQNDDPSVGPMHPLLISRTLSQIAYADIKEIKRIGRGKILAEMNSFTMANNLVLNPKLEKENLRAFIPSYRTVRTGIVKDVPQHFEESDLLQFFDSPFKVVEVKRLNRRLKINGELKYVPSRSISLKFAGQILPKYVFLCRNRYEVFPYISKVKICYSCHRIGHISKNCKGKPRCLYCGGDKHDSLSSCPSINDNPMCINCQGEHLATSYDCPIIIRHKKILSLAATENIPIIEARRRISQSTAPPKDILYDYSKFPLLRSNRAVHADNSINNNQTSDTQAIGSSRYNRFSVLSASKHMEDTPVNISSSSYNLSSSGSHKSNNLSSSKSGSRLRNNNSIVSTSHKSPQKSDKNSINNSFSAHRKLLFSPNGRLPSTVNNGAGYYTRHATNSSSTEDNNTHHIKDWEEQINPESINYKKESNINIAALNNVFLSLTKNMESIYHMVRTICLPNNEDTFSFSHFSSSNNNNE